MCCNSAKTNETPLVSVYCMTYNQEDTIAQTIESIIGQKTNFPFELIVHDDASTDRTGEIVRRYAEAYPHIVRPILQRENQYKKCNIIKTHIHPIGRGSLIAICEGDDYWNDDTKLQRQADYMTQHPECTLCFHSVLQLNSNGEYMTVRPLKSSCEVSPSMIIKRGGMFCPTVSSMFRREVMDVWPPFRDEADVYDYPAQVLAASMGAVYYIDRIMGVYRFASAGSWTSQNKDHVNYDHVENETRWLSKFNAYTDEKYANDVHYHLAHMWFTEYRKTFDPVVRKNALQYTRVLPMKDRLVFSVLIAIFSIMGRHGNKLWERFKKLLLK